MPRIEGTFKKVKPGWGKESSSFYYGWYTWDRKFSKDGLSRFRMAILDM